MKCSKCEKNNTKANSDLCGRCAKAPETLNNSTEEAAGMVKPTVVVCELLTYVFQYWHQSSPRGMVDTVSDFYSPEEVVSAIKCLSDAYPNNDLIGDEVRRSKRSCITPGMSDTAKTKLVDDLIMKGVKPLVDSKAPQVIFCAANLERVPKFKPEAINIHSILQRVQLLEAKTERFSEVERRVNSMTTRPVPNSHGTKSQPMTLDDQQFPSLGSPIQRNQDTTDSTVVPSYSGAVQTEHSSEERTELRRREEQRQKERQERQRLLQRAKIKTVTGKKSSDDVRAVGVNRSIYLTKVDSDYSEDDIKSYMQSNNVKVKYIRQINGRKGLGLKKSFMIVVPEKDFEVTMNEEFWPNGLECREWLNENQLRAVVDENQLPAIGT